MEIAVWPNGWKIRSIKDAVRFVNMVDEKGFGKSEGEIYWTCGADDFCLDVKAKRVSYRPKSCRGNVFFPYFGVLDPVKLVFTTRKHINKQILDF